MSALIFLFGKEIGNLQHVAETTRITDFFAIGDFAVESVTVRMQEWKKPSKTIKVQNPKIVERKMETPSNDRETRAFAMLNETRCAPTYAKLTHMALNRTKGRSLFIVKLLLHHFRFLLHCDDVGGCFGYTLFLLEPLNF